MGPRQRCVPVIAVVVLVLAWMACLKPAFGRDYYVASKPGSGAGTQEDPFGMADLPGPDGKLSKALSGLQPGDTLWFRGGEYRCRTAKGAYYLGYIRPPRSGEPGKPISFRALPGEPVVLVTAEGGQPLLGTNDGRPLNHVRFEGFVVHGSIGWISGRGVEIAYCEVIGQFVDTADNHDGIRVQEADGAWIHHCIIRGVRGRSGNSCGIKVYKSRNLIVEDNYVYDNTRGIFDKDSGTNNTYRRNFMTRNDCGFHGNNQGTYLVAHLYDNVIDGGVALGYLTDGTDVHDNLIRGDTLAGHWAGELWNTHLWNNIVVAAGKEVVAYNESKNAFIQEGERRHLRYMDHNLYTAPPKYTFGRDRFTLDQMRGKGFESHSLVAASISDVFVDEKTWELKDPWKKAGRFGDALGPDNVAQILDTTRYGPRAMPKAATGRPRDGRSETAIDPVREVVEKAEAPAAGVPRYDVFEALLTGAKTYANPFVDVTVIATFTGPSGRKLTAYAFHDGKNTWRVRVAPDELGTWRYVTTASDTHDAGLHNQGGGFRCVASSSKGFLRVDPVNRYYFAFSDGSPFFGLGDTFTATSGTLGEAHRRAYLDARAGKPFNFLRVFASLTFNAWTDQPHAAVTADPAELWPWGGSPAAPDYDRLNPRYFQRFERILGELKRRGVFAEIIVFNLYERPFKDPSRWTAARARLWARNLVGRLAAHTTVFLWTITQEYERYPRGEYKYEPGDDEWVRAMGRLIHECDPQGHPTTVHPWGGHGPAGGESVVESGAIGQRFGAAAELDVLTHQHNSYGTGRLVPEPSPGHWDGPAAGVEKAIWADRRWNKPVINTEYGYEWLEGYGVNFNAQAHGADKCRRAAWRIFASGGAALAAGFSGTYLASDNAKVYFDRTQRFAPFTIADMGHARQLQYLYDFITMRTDFRTMNPAQALASAPNLCLANPGREYVVYAPSGGDLRLDLPPAAGQWAVEWLNPRDGRYSSAGTVAGGGRRTFTAADTQDWVLHVKASPSPALPD